MGLEGLGGGIERVVRRGKGGWGRGGEVVDRGIGGDGRGMGLGVMSLLFWSGCMFTIGVRLGGSLAPLLGHLVEGELSWGGIKGT